MEGMSEGTERPRPWSLVETTITAKDRIKGSEDTIITTDECYAVLDGVSSLPEHRIDGMTPGQFAIGIGARALQEAASFPDPKDIVPHVTRRLAEAFAGTEINGYPSFVFAAFFPKHNLIIRVGDCSYLIDGGGNNPGLKMDHAKAVLRKRVVEKRLSEGASVEEVLEENPGRERVTHLAQHWQKHYANHPDAQDFGYGVMNGQSIPEYLIEYIPVPATAKSVVLASDGYPPQTLRPNLRETEQALQEAQDKDPLGLAGPDIRILKPMQEGQTATDDRSYLRLER